MSPNPVGLSYCHVNANTVPEDGDIPVFDDTIGQYEPTPFHGDFVVMSNGANPPTPMDDGAGNFLYVGYTP